MLEKLVLKVSALLSDLSWFGVFSFLLACKVKTEEITELNIVSSFQNLFRIRRKAVDEMLIPGSYCIWIILHLY